MHHTTTDALEINDEFLSTKLSGRDQVAPMATGVDGRPCYSCRPPSLSNARHPLPNSNNLKIAQQILASNMPVHRLFWPLMACRLISARLDSNAIASDLFEPTFDGTPAPDISLGHSNASFLIGQSFSALGALNRLFRRQEKVCPDPAGPSCSAATCCLSDQQCCGLTSCCPLGTVCGKVEGQCCPDEAETCGGDLCAQPGSVCCGTTFACKPGAVCNFVAKTCYPPEWIPCPAACPSYPPPRSKLALQTANHLRGG